MSSTTARIGDDGRLDIRSISTTHGSETVTLQTVIDNNADITGYGADDRNLMVLQPYLGRVGIGTVSPVAKLQVNYTQGTLSDMTMYSGSPSWYDKGLGLNGG